MLIHHILITGVAILLLGWQIARLNHQVPALISRDWRMERLVMLLLLLLLLHLLRLGNALLQLGRVHVGLSRRVGRRGSVPRRLLRSAQTSKSAQPQNENAHSLSLTP